MKRLLSWLIIGLLLLVFWKLLLAYIAIAALVTVFVLVWMAVMK